MADSQVPWGIGAISGAISEPAWRAKPAWYLVTADDKMIPPDAQRAMSKRAGATVVEVKGSHAIYVSQPGASLLRGSGMPNHMDGVLVNVMSGYEISRVRTKFDPLRIFPAVTPHPVQPNRESSGHRYLSNTSLPTIKGRPFERLTSETTSSLSVCREPIHP